MYVQCNMVLKTTDLLCSLMVKICRSHYIWEHFLRHCITTVNIFVTDRHEPIEFLIIWMRIIEDVEIIFLGVNQCLFRSVNTRDSNMNFKRKSFKQIY